MNWSVRKWFHLIWLSLSIPASTIASYHDCGPCEEPNDPALVAQGADPCLPLDAGTAVAGEPCKECDGEGGIRDKPMFSSIPGEPCKQCDGNGNVINKPDGYQPSGTHCKECINGELVDVISMCKGATGWMPTSYAMQCGTCGPYALQARDIGHCDPVADCGCEETTHDFMRRVRLQCNNPNYDVHEIVSRILECCAPCADLTEMPLAFIACAMYRCVDCTCSKLEQACGGCKIVSFEVIQQRVGCL